jgi:hypothetical protein
MNVLRFGKSNKKEWNILIYIKLQILNFANTNRLKVLLKLKRQKVSE